MSHKKKIMEEILYKPLIGRTIEIVSSKTSSLVGIVGKIAYESSNFFFLEKADGEIIRVLKRTIVFRVSHAGTELLIDGRMLLNTTLKRIKNLK